MDQPRHIIHVWVEKNAGETDHQHFIRAMSTVQWHKTTGFAINVIRENEEKQGVVLERMHAFKLDNPDVIVYDGQGKLLTFIGELSSIFARPDRYVLIEAEPPS